MTKPFTRITAALLLLFHPVSTLAIKFQIIEPQEARMAQPNPEWPDDTPTYNATALQAELDAHRATWNAFVGKSKNYDMSFERICFCPEQWRGPFAMRVRDGNVQSATYTSEAMRESTVDPDMLRGLLTVDGVLDKIQQGLDRRYVDLQVTYNETAGYPASFYSDMSKRIADDEMTFRISDVVLVDQ
ncbi:hypothetical protein ACHAWX_004737 [Stephanocyclus meneghinianus]